METYLYVRLTVERDTVPEFKFNARQFLKSNFLQDKGWKFLHGFEVLGASLIDDLTRTTLEPAGGRDLVSFINVWKLPPAVDIASVMVELSELAPYVTLDNLVIDEKQDVVFRINGPATQNEEDLTAALKAGAKCALVRHYIFRDSLAKFALSSAALAAQFELNTGYAYAGCYQNITGLLNEFWEFWKLKDQGEATPKEVRHCLHQSVAGTEGMIADSYRESIFFDKSSLEIVNPGLFTETTPPDGPDDGIVIVKAASYWKDP